MSNETFIDENINLANSVSTTSQNNPIKVNQETQTENDFFPIVDKIGESRANLYMKVSSFSQTDKFIDFSSDIFYKYENKTKFEINFELILD